MLALSSLAMPRRIVISVSSDLVTDQRVHRTAITLKDAGYKVMVLGRVLPDSPQMPSRRYRFIRFRLLFLKGPLFYATLNIRLFWYLLWNHADILIANDLDTLMPNYLISRLRNIPLVYDSHEYYTGVPELENRPDVKKIWKRIERWILPQLKYCITVNESIAKLYLVEYKVPFTVIRNVPFPDDMIYPDKNKLREQLGLPQNKPIYILQGAGINIQRGAEEAVEAMQHVPGILLIVGNGDVIPKLKDYVLKSGLNRKVFFIPRQSQKQLRIYTRSADAGLSLDKDTNINYRFSLPNKIFDYIQAGIPVIASPLPEVKKIVADYDVGMLIESHEPGHLAEIFIQTLAPENISKWSVNLKKAAEELNWGNEKEKLLKLISSIP